MKSFSAFAVVDMDEGVYFETVADEARKCVDLIDNSRLSGDEHDKTMARMLIGRVRVCAVHFEIGEPVDGIDVTKA